MEKLTDYIDLIHVRSNRSKRILFILTLVIIAQIGLGIWGYVRESNSSQQAWLGALPAQAQAYEKKGCYDLAALSYRTILSYQKDPETTQKILSLQKDMQSRLDSLSNAQSSASEKELSLNELMQSADCTFEAVPLPTAIAPGSPDTLPYVLLLISSGIALTGGLVFYLQSKLPRKPNVKIQPNPLDVMIGSNHGGDILGEFFEVAFQSQTSGRKYTQDYLVAMQEEVLRRMIENYHLKPIGEPGEGPIPFDPIRHRPYGNIQEKTSVYILSVGWEQDGRVVLPALVSTDPKKSPEKK